MTRAPRRRGGWPGRSAAAVGIALALVSAPICEARPVWTRAQANAWYARRPWLVGVNYVPSTAVNQLEMWQADTFDLPTIDRELGWAQDLRINTVRVFLHDLLWREDPEGLKARMDAFLTVAARHRIKPLFVLFDSCWDPDPKPGPQRPPLPGVHNSRWVQSPGREGLNRPELEPGLKAYTKGVVGAFAKDERVLGWDIWNEPDSPGGKAFPPIPDKAARVEALMVKAFAWAREEDPVQPLTAPVYQPGEWPKTGTSSLERAQLTQSDILSFHDYRWPESFAQSAEALARFGRPVLATEFMARGVGSTFDSILPIAKRAHVGVFSWGFVDGRTQSKFAWDSWKRPNLDGDDFIWFHDLLKADGTPYRPAETTLIRRMAAPARGGRP